MPLVLVTGAAGYIGSVLVGELLRAGHIVRGLDLLQSGGNSLLAYYGDPRFSLIKGDIRRADDVKRALVGVTTAVHLAAIVGDAACNRDPENARTVNLEGTQLLAEIAGSAGVTRFIFASTCSNYGVTGDALATEDTPLRPQSLYAETKVAAEHALLSMRGALRPTILRLATVFGLSPRPRFDLTVNDFTREAFLRRKLVVYGAQLARPYVHVRDLAHGMVRVVEADGPLVTARVYNVGDSRENYTKRQIVELILGRVPDLTVEHIERSADVRDYRVSFDAFRRAFGFASRWRVADGIDEVLDALRLGLIADPDDPRYAN